MKIKLTIVDCVFIQFNIDPRHELPYTFIATIVFKFIWENRAKGKVSSFSLNAEVEAITAMLLKSKFTKAVKIVAGGLRILT